MSTASGQAALTWLASFEDHVVFFSLVVGGLALVGLLIER